MVRTICAVMSVLMLTDPAASPGWGASAVVEAEPGALVRVGAFAVFRADCSIGAAPDIRLQKPPRHGAVDTATGTLSTARVPHCPRLSAPARLVRYRSDAGFVGIDELTFEVVNSGARQIVSHTVTISVGTLAMMR